MSRMVWIGRRGFAIYPLWLEPRCRLTRPTRWNAVTYLQVGPLVLAWFTAEPSS